MNTEPKLEAYLARLDSYFSEIPVSERADIIMEMKSHVFEVREHHPTQDIDTILAELGDPETVGNRYLRERGLQPQKSPKKTITPFMMWLPSSLKWVVMGLKWVVIGFLGLCICMLGVVLAGR